MSIQNNIIWSGGFDSTALLLDLFLRNNSKPLEQRERFTVISFNSDNIPNSKEDRTARNKIKELFCEYDGSDYFDFYEMENLVVPSAIKKQALAWPFYSLHEGFSKNINIYFGYIKTDDFFHYKSEALNFYKAMETFLDFQIVDNSERYKITVHFPFEWREKRELVCYYANFETIYDAISWAGDDGVVKTKYKDEFTNVLVQIKNSNYMAKPTLKTKGLGPESVKVLVDIQNSKNPIDIPTVEFKTTIL